MESQLNYISYPYKHGSGSVGHSHPIATLMCAFSIKGMVINFYNSFLTPKILKHLSLSLQENS